MNKLIAPILLLLLLLLQGRLWFGNGSILKVMRLKDEVLKQQQLSTRLRERNQLVDAEVQDLKHKTYALEEKARTNLGMIKQGETFYQTPS